MLTSEKKTRRNVKTHRFRHFFSEKKRPLPPPTTNTPRLRGVPPHLRIDSSPAAPPRPSARASGSRAASSLHPRTPRSRRGTGARAAAAQQELHCERQPAPAAAHHKRTRTTAPRPAFHVPSHGLCRAGLGPREPQRLPPQRAVPCTAHRSQCTPPRSSYPPPPRMAHRMRLSPEGPLLMRPSGLDPQQEHRGTRCRTSI